MRRFGPRPALSAAAVKHLAQKAKAIAEHKNPKPASKRIYTSSRQAQWFREITLVLKMMSGPGERCMFCSGSECSQVEHFRPKAVFPLQAMEWENLLWVCGICNQIKGDRFPPDTEAGEQIINPMTENVWEFFFVDEFGNLTERWSPELGRPHPRAHATVRILGLDRDALQQTRQFRLEDLKQKTQDALTLLRRGEIDIDLLRQRVDAWMLQPFQPDVADYFLRGPGRAEEPFSKLFERLAAGD
jgi:uncharacterized protein (TIGR02646 family)